MQRRDFLKMASASGVVIPSWALLPAAQAQTGPYTGKILINIHADGGIDQSSWADPRETDPTINNYAGVTPAGVAGNIRYAPMGANQAFFDRYFRQILVINGVHSETNSHDDGARVHATGRLDMGYPTWPNCSPRPTARACRWRGSTVVASAPAQGWWRRPRCLTPTRGAR